MQHCAMCHGSGVGDESILAKGRYIHPPQFAKNGVDDDPEGVTYWKIEHGIRWSGMPADKLPAPSAAIWNKPAAE